MLIGIIGKTNTGKSTSFKALTLAEVEISNRVFTTIKPNHAVGFVKAECPEKKAGVRCQPNHGYCVNGKRFIPVELLDVAGLVPDAHKGKGLGLQFLDDLRQADAFIHVIDISGSTNDQGESVEKGTYDPSRDIEFLENEIGEWFFGLLKKNWAKFAKDVEMQKKKLVESVTVQFSGLKITEDQVSSALKKTGLPEETPAQWSEQDLKKFAFELRKLSKRMIIAANKIDVPGSEESLKRLKERFPDYIIVPCSAESELALKEAAKHSLIDYIPGEGKFGVKDGEGMSEKQEKALEFIRSHVLEKFGSTGVQKCLDSAVYDLLDHIVVYPVANVNHFTDKKGKVLPDALIVPDGTTLKEFAGKVHSDMADKFIGGVEFGTRRKIGADHELSNGEVVEIIFGK